MRVLLPQLAAGFCALQKWCQDESRALILQLFLAAAQVCAHAGVHPSEIAYIEAHGTGTVVGDAQELGALEEHYAIGGRHTPEEPLLIGSGQVQHGPLRGLLRAGGCFAARSGSRVHA